MSFKEEDLGNNSNNSLDFKSIQVCEAQFIHMNLLLVQDIQKDQFSYDASLLNLEDQLM